MNRVAAIDIGNSSLKLGVFEDNLLVEDKTFKQIEEAKIYIESKKISQIIVCSVSVEKKLIQDEFQEFDLVYLDHLLPLPITNAYKSPETLGMDRIAAAIGSEKYGKNKNRLIIDIGTCITYDLIDKNSIYRGGSISPGIGLRYSSMNRSTENLPLLESSDWPDLLGTNTEKCIQSGVMEGINCEINGMIDQYNEQWDNLLIIICGGGTKIFETRLKAHIFAIPNLVLEGLNEVWNYNINLKCIN